MWWCGDGCGGGDWCDGEYFYYCDVITISELTTLAPCVFTKYPVETMVLFVYNARLTL